ncbi:MAG: phosphatidylserine decarboxylase [Bacillota bacterium]
MDIFYIDRRTGERKKEVVAGDLFLKWLYGTTHGEGLLELIIKRKVFSSVYGKLQDMTWSSRKIKKFIQQLEIDMLEAENEDIASYKCFNDFFARKLKVNARNIVYDSDRLISPADGRVFAYENIDVQKVIQVKGQEYSLVELFGDEELAEAYMDGVCVVIRLCPADYHRFHFPDSGIVEDHKRIEGDYYSVNPISLRKITKVYCQNKRELTEFQSEHFGPIILVEVGATCVGSIVQTAAPRQYVQKGQEKGYFKFGGSTVIMFLMKNTVNIDQDILKNTENGLETKLNMGETIGRRIKQEEMER